MDRYTSQDVVRGYDSVSFSLQRGELHARKRYIPASTRDFFLFSRVFTYIHILIERLVGFYSFTCTASEGLAAVLSFHSELRHGGVKYVRLVGFIHTFDERGREDGGVGGLLLANACARVCSVNLCDGRRSFVCVGTESRRAVFRAYMIYVCMLVYGA